MTPSPVQSDRERAERFFASAMQHHPIISRLAAELAAVRREEQSLCEHHIQELIRERNNAKEKLADYLSRASYEAEQWQKERQAAQDTIDVLVKERDHYRETRRKVLEEAAGAAAGFGII